MMSAEPTSTARDDAIARIKSQRAFAVNLAVYVAVNAVLVVVWALTRDDGDGFWPIWVIGFWGIGIVVQAWHAYGPGRRPITESEVQRELRRRS